MVVMGGCSQTFGGPLRANDGGTPATEVPKAGALAGAMGAGCPSCLLTLPSLSALSPGRGVLTMGFVQTGQCLLSCQSSFRPSHTLTQRHTHKYTDPDTSCRPCPPPHLD